MRGMMRSIVPVILAAAVGLPMHAAAQVVSDDGAFTNLTTLAISFPVGDTRRYVSVPSWAGVGWEGQWTVRKGLLAGVGFSAHDFYDRSHGTTNFPSGSATGDQLRDLLLITAMGTGRWYPRKDQLGPYVASGAGVVFAQQYYQLGLSPGFMRTAFHLAVAPETGVAIPVMPGVAAALGLRYTMASSGGRYLGGGSRKNRFVTVTFGFAER